MPPRAAYRNGAVNTAVSISWPGFCLPIPAFDM
jgi:hypothetical protein